MKTHGTEEKGIKGTNYEEKETGRIHAQLRWKKFFSSINNIVKASHIFLNYLFNASCVEIAWR